MEMLLVSYETLQVQAEGQTLCYRLRDDEDGADLFVAGPVDVYACRVTGDERADFDLRLRARAVLVRDAKEARALRDATPQVTLARAQPQGVGLEMCDRDILLRTATLADSFVDRKVDFATLRLVDWNETALVGVYKLADGAMVPCVDQADADANACLSVWDYQAKHAATGLPIAYDLRGGGLTVDAGIDRTQDHQVYVVAAPSIPAVYGGQVRMFDGYLQFSPGIDVEAIEPRARALDPSKNVHASVVRVLIYYPPGVKLTHVLRLVTYRPAGSS